MLGAAPATETVAVWVAAPPGPRHVSSNSVVLVMASVDSEPLVETDPVQPPELVQLVAPLLLQVRIALAPGATVVGRAVSETVGADAAGFCTATFTDCEVEPPVPEQLSVNVVALVSAPLVKSPETGCVPFHPPVAIQDWALVDCQCRETVSPAATDDAAAVKVTVGASAVEPDAPDWAPLCVTPLL
jgi:hypothetical protein